MMKFIAVAAFTLLCGSGLCPEHLPAPEYQHGEARNDERCQARWFNGYNRRKRNQGQYQKRY